MTKRVAGIVLAAGEGRRMGRLKQSLPLCGKTMLESTVDTALASSLHRVVVVLGHQAELLVPLLDKRPVTVVINREYRGGQSSSLKAGLRALHPEFDAALFLLGDQPLVSLETIDAIVATYRNTAAPIIVPFCAGRRGNPVLFSRETFPLLEDLQGDAGARVVFLEHPGMVMPLTVEDSGVLLDVDTGEDYLRLLEIMHDEDRQ